MYPVMLQLLGRSVLVVGGGEVALRKVEGLLAEGARPTVIAPEAVATLEAHATRGAIELRRRAYQAGDVRGFALVFAATDDREVNVRVHDDACAEGLWVNVADVPDLCTFHLPARIRRGAMQVAVGSDGGAPFVVRRLRQMLERRLGPEWSEWMEAARHFRKAVRGRDLPPAAAERLYDRFFRESVDVERLRARVPRAEEIDGWLARAGGVESAVRPPPVRALHPGPWAGAARGPRVGLVSLVGGGPGDPGLLTVRARQRLLAADAVVYDRLAEGALPPDLPDRVELHSVGKEAGRHPVPQEEINALLVRLASSGKRTVRLKGGDPLVFGRGAEEADALRSAGIPFEIVPGVTAALGATAAAGIPVTHRGEAVRLTIVTAHEAAKRGGPQVRWEELARDPHATLVGYMGVASLPEIAAQLQRSGMPASTPAALVSRGTTAGQRVIVSTIARLHEAGLAAGIRPPAIFVVGPTVRKAASLDWFVSRPLAGERLGLFAGSDGVAATLDVAGAEVVEVPRPLGPAARVVLAAAPMSGFVLRSAAEVEAIDEELGTPGLEPQPRAVCLGRAAADRARALGWVRVEELAEGAAPEELVAVLATRGPSLDAQEA
jgi:uroporphyrin-III C-methyltransferase/precorrin-2 dehydrogenase/sirohydrochlorin ferrochelatase